MLKSVRSHNGDGGPAIEAILFNPTSVAIDEWFIYFADSGHNRIRKIGRENTEDAGKISHFAGLEDGTVGDGETGFNNPMGIFLAPGGKRSILYIADTGNHRIAEIEFRPGVRRTSPYMTVVNERGQPTCSTSEGTETCKDLDKEEDTNPIFATLFSPTNIVLDSEGNMFIADTGNKAIRLLHYPPPGRGGGYPPPGRGGGQLFRRERGISTIARNIESFGIFAEERNKILVSDVTTNSILRLSRFLPTLPPTGQFDVHR
jgi:sugar lactone lactonase YvrE